MSSQTRGSGVGGTLTSGIQDVSAILPIIGTEQCDRHMGSALSGGYLYAAATPLSIFGSLGIVKTSVSVLISSISIPNLLPFSKLKSPGNRSPMFFGAKMLKDAGFELTGTVAPLIGMDGSRFKAETQLLRILEEKHIDDPEKVSVTWKSKQWNIMLVLFTIVAAAMSGVPYFALIFGPTSWRPNTNLQWLFPFLRTAGSCLASVCCQFIIQSRVITLMKNRILFMAVHRQIERGLSKDNKADLDSWLKYHLQWDSDLPAEQCIRSLENYFSSSRYPILYTSDIIQHTQPHISIDIPMEPPPPIHWTRWLNPTSSSSSPPPSPPSNPLFKSDPVLDNYYFRIMRDIHFPSPKRDRIFILASWIILCLSLPAIVAGYVGCFTLVSATPSPGNGPLVWLGLEAALSIIRILLWAWNPKFDEDTDITVELQLDFREPVEWTEELNDFIHDLEKEKTKPLLLFPERQFLEAITTYSGPLDRFQTSENIALYFTLMADYSIRIKDVNREYLSPLITVFDLNTRSSVTLLHLGGSFYWFDSDVKYDAPSSEINATLKSTMWNSHPWQTQTGTLFNSLENYYTSLALALNWNHQDRYIAELERKWDLSFKPTLITSGNLPPSNDYSLLYPDQRYEHHLKIKLVELWSRWTTEGMNAMIAIAWNDCYEASEDAMSEKGKWEHTELDRVGAWECVIREHVLLASSLELEDILRAKLEKSIIQLGEGQQDWRWMRNGFEISRRKRLENERGEAKERMKKVMKDANVLAERLKRSWKEQGRFAPKWQEGIDLIDKKWSEGISRGPAALENVQSEIDNVGRIDIPFNDEETTRYGFVDEVRRRFAHWGSQRKNERREMDATIDRIRSVGDQREEMDSAYRYPEPDMEAPFQFAYLGSSSSKGKACSAIVYDVGDCSAEAVCTVVKKSTTRSVINVDPSILAAFPPNDHLLFLSCGGEEGPQDQPAFIQQNRARWWDQQMANSALFYFTPKGVTGSSCFVSLGPIAQIFIFLTVPSRVRLRLLHSAENQFLLSIQQNDKNLATLSDGIPKTDLKMQALELEKLRPGRHELQVVVAQNSETEYGEYGSYYLRDILIEFFDDPVPAVEVYTHEDHTGNGITPTISDGDQAEEGLTDMQQNPVGTRDSDARQGSENE